MTESLNQAALVKCLICDVDGVLTDGSLYFDASGVETKAFHVLDGVGLKLLMCAGIEVAVITGSVSSIIDHRMQQLGIQHYFKGQINKQTAYETLKKRLALTDRDMAYIGDDLPDAPIMRQVGFSIAVANALEPVKAIASWVTRKQGGHGAVREACDLILQCQQRSESALECYLSA